MKMIEYNAIVNGEKVRNLWLPSKTSQDERNEVRSQVAKDFGAPRHYVRLVRAKLLTKRRVI